MPADELVLSSLPKTWILDFDGTVVKHNGYLVDGKDTILENSAEFIKNIPVEDKIIILTARPDNERPSTIEFLKNNHIRYDAILFGLPTGERILINDKKPSGLVTAVAANIDRDEGIGINITINPLL